MKHPIQPGDITENPAHVRRSTYVRHGCAVRTVSVKTNAAARQLGTAVGEYITIETGALCQLSPARDMGNCLAEVLESVLTPFSHQRLCVCGLGSADNICDSLGPATIKLLPALFLESVDTLSEGRFSKLVTLAPNVQDATNLEPEVMAAGMVAASRADVLVLIDAIATVEPQYLCNNIQVSTAGNISVHAGARAVDWESTGVPVIFISVPTLLRGTESEHGYFTVYRIQEAIPSAAAVIAYALIKTSYPMLSEQNCIEAVRLRQTFPLDW